MFLKGTHLAGERPASSRPESYTVDLQPEPSGDIVDQSSLHPFCLLITVPRPVCFLIREMEKGIFSLDLGSGNAGPSCGVNSRKEK